MDSHGVDMRYVIRGAIVLLLAIAAFFSWKAYHVYRDVKNIVVPVPRTTGEPTLTIPPLNGNQRTNFLVLGSDNDRKKQEKNPLSQSMIVVSVDPTTYKVILMSIPRDFYVPIRGHGMQKIDLAFKLGQLHGGGFAGGVALARSTVERLFGITIDYYAWVGLNGFTKVIDTFNGVTVDVKYPVLDDSYPNDLSASDPYGFKRIFIPPGWQHLDGTTALEYVRSRHGAYIGDFGRSERQQQVLLALNKKATVFGVLTNIVQLADSLSQSVRTDLDISQDYQVEQLARRIKPGDVTQVVLAPPSYSRLGYAGPQSVVYPNWPAIHARVHQLFTTAPAASPITQPSPEPTPVIHASPTVPSLHATATARPRPAVTPRPRPSATVMPQQAPSPQIPAFTRLPGRLLFVQGGNIFMLDRNRNLRQLTFTGDAAMPNPSPDERYLAFVRFPGGQYESNLWILDLRTHREWQVAHIPAPDVRNHLWAAWPSWTRDERRLVFSWDYQKVATAPSDARSSALAIWTIGTHGEQPVRITTPNLGAAGDLEPRMRSHSSTQFTYIKWSYAPISFQPYSQLALWDTSSGKSWTLTPAGGRVIQEAWDGAGKAVAFVRLNPRGQDEMAAAPVIQKKGAWQLGARIVLAQGQIAQPAFTPEGKWASYLKVSGDGFDLYLVPSHGGTPVRIPEVGSAIDARWHPVWMR